MAKARSLEATLRVPSWGPREAIFFARSAHTPRIQDPWGIQSPGSSPPPATTFGSPAAKHDSYAWLSTRRVGGGDGTRKGPQPPRPSQALGGKKAMARSLEATLRAPSWGPRDAFFFARSTQTPRLQDPWGIPSPCNALQGSPPSQPQTGVQDLSGSMRRRASPTGAGALPPSVPRCSSRTGLTPSCPGASARLGGKPAPDGPLYRRPECPRHTPPTACRTHFLECACGTRARIKPTSCPTWAPSFFLQPASLVASPVGC